MSTRVVFVRVVWDKQAVPFRLPGIRMFDLHVGPEPGYPYGRKGLALLGAWRQLRTEHCTGMVVMDGDVVIDPLDTAVMLETVGRYPDDVWTAPVRLWPASTQRESWVWGHWNGQGPSQQPCADPTFFSFCFTYIPRRVIDQAASMGLDRWTFPGVDRRMSLAARAARVPVRVVDGCTPKHLHY
jgi:hypothetical protein